MKVRGMTIEAISGFIFDLDKEYKKHPKVVGENDHADIMQA